MHYLFLAVAVVFEVFATSMMKFSNGLTKLIPTIFMFLGYGVAFAFLALTLKKMDVSVAYALWSGLGILLISVIGVTFLHEPISAFKVLGILLVISGVVVLNFSGAH